MLTPSTNYFTLISNNQLTRDIFKTASFSLHQPLILSRLKFKYVSCFVFQLHPKLYENFINKSTILLDLKGHYVIILLALSKSKLAVSTKI